MHPVSVDDGANFIPTIIVYLLIHTEICYMIAWRTNLARCSTKKHVAIRNLPNFPIPCSAFKTNSVSHKRRIPGTFPRQMRPVLRKAQQTAGESRSEAPSSCILIEETVYKGCLPRLTFLAAPGIRSRQLQSPV